jgi:hypothetical protein
MIWRIALFAALCTLSSLARAETSLSLGKAISQFDDVHIEETPEERCPADAICLRGWSRWTLDVKQTLAGPRVNGRIHVVMMQHAPMADSLFEKELLFVLEHIDNPAERKRLHADYKLLEFTYAETLYCTSSDPRQWGVPSDRIRKQQSDDEVSYCFPDPRVSDE